MLAGNAPLLLLLLTLLVVVVMRFFKRPAVTLRRMLRTPAAPTAVFVCCNVPCLLTKLLLGCPSTRPSQACPAVKLHLSVI